MEVTEFRNKGTWQWGSMDEQGMDECAKDCNVHQHEFLLVIYMYMYIYIIAFIKIKLKN